MALQRWTALLAVCAAWWLLRGGGGSGGGGGATAVVRSVEAQTLAFFARPHDGLPSVPLAGPGVWTGAELAAREGDWLEVIPGEAKLVFLLVLFGSLEAP